MTWLDYITRLNNCIVTYTTGTSGTSLLSFSRWLLLPPRLDLVCSPLEATAAMINTSICLILSFVLSMVTAMLLVDRTAILMVIKLILAAAIVILFIGSVTRYGRRPMWLAIGLVAVTTLLLLIAYLMDRSPFEAGYVPLFIGEVLAMNLWVVGESAYRIGRKTNPTRALRVTAAVTLGGLTLGWLFYFWFFFLFKDS